MRRSMLLYLTVILAGCVQPEKTLSDSPFFNDFAYDESDAIPNDLPLPDVGINQRPVLGVKKVLVSVVHWQDGDTLNYPLIEKHTLSDDPDSLRSYILAASQGKLTLNGQVISYTSGPRPDICKSGTPMPMALATSEGDKAARANGLDPDNFDFLINLIDCGGNASANRPGRTIGVYGQSLSPHVYKHEFGHNLGYAHGSTYTKCAKNGETVKAPAGCTTIGYGDTGDPVSGSGTLYPAFNRWYSGWLDEAQATTIKTTGLYRLGVLGDSNPQLYLIDRPGNGARTRNFLALEYRKPTAFDNFPPNDNRVTGVWARFSTLVYYSSYMINTQLDGTPETATTADPTLQSGRTLVDEDAKIKVKVCSTDANGASIAVSVEGESLPDCDTPFISAPQQDWVTGPLPMFSGSTSVPNATITVISFGNPAKVLATSKADELGRWSVRANKELDTWRTISIQAGQALNGQPAKWSEGRSFHVIER
ncbi:transposase [Pseudomonas sp. BIC9C]|uniref:transposase n=1 Tax=Pseudomonas sp. BIC9C TaxID=3078458 RepID=UPI002AD52737|nr:transposase [Pseudomonas sp. BIC9C]